MSIAWMAPAALGGIALVVLPIAVHLLVRQLARQMPFPSLRFLQETQLASLRRRRIQDAGLLVCRMLIIATAALALAGPVLITSARMTAFAARTSRAIVVVDAADETATGPLREDAFRSEVFTRARLVDALADATRWLGQQPPSSREIVVAGPLRRGAVTESDLATVPAQIGIRFHPLPEEAPSSQTISILTRRDGALMKVDRSITLSGDSTTVSEIGRSPISNDLVSIASSSDDAVLAQAALRAALDRGVPWTDFTTPVVVVWEGGDSGGRADARVIDMAVPKPASSAAGAVYDALVRGTPRPELKEPVALTPEQLTGWTRAPGPVTTDAPLSDEGDRQWLWAAVLLLLLLEAQLRRSATVRSPSREEAKVA